MIEDLINIADFESGGRRERDLRTGFKIPEGLGVPSVQAALGSDRAVTIEETLGLMDPALGWDTLGRPALCGCASPAELGREHVRRAPPASVYSG